MRSKRETLDALAGETSNLLNRARDLRRAGQLAEALACFEDALRIAPRSARGYAGYGATLVKLGRIEEAILSFREAVRLRVNYPLAWAALGSAYMKAGDAPDAIDSYHRAARLDGGTTSQSNLLYTLNFDPGRTPEAVFAEHAEWGKRRCPAASPAPHRNSREPERILKVGYAGGKLPNVFLVPVLGAHDRAAVHVTCYNSTAAAGGSGDLQACADRWRSIHEMPDDEADALIREDGIDILIDLCGHTGGNRLNLFARKPAPVQVTYLGYPNTTGIPAIDYRITDCIADPPGIADSLHTEELIRLPRCFVAYQPFAGFTEVSACPALRNGYVTFGSFSNPLKWNAAVVGAWAAILKRVPGSRLILHHGGCAERSPVVYETLRSRVLESFEAHGVGAARLTLIGFLETAEHFALYREVDLSLDPFPYNGTTAVCEGLWMGVPAVALAGQTHVARVATSILTAVGLSHLVAQSVEQYVDLAVSLARNVEELAALRPALRRRMAASPVMDGRGLAQAMEEAYRRIWRRWCAASTGQPSPSGLP